MSKVYLPTKDGRLSKISFGGSSKRISMKPENSQPSSSLIKHKQQEKIKIQDKQAEKQEQNLNQNLKQQQKQKPTIKNLYKPLKSPPIQPLYSESAQICSEIVEEIYLQANKLHRKNQLQRDLPKFNAKHTIWLCEQLANFKNYPVDNFQPFDEWFIDQEPPIQKKDNRQVFSVKKQQNQEILQKILEKEKAQQNDIIMGQELEILLAQHKLYFKIPEGLENLKNFNINTNYDKKTLKLNQTYKENLNKTFNQQNQNEIENLNQNQIPVSKTSNQSKSQFENQNKNQYTDNSLTNSQDLNSQLETEPSQFNMKKEDYMQRFNQDPNKITYYIKNKGEQSDNKIFKFETKLFEEAGYTSVRKYRSTSNYLQNKKQNSMSPPKERFYVRKILQREKMVRTINDTLKDYQINNGINQNKLPEIQLKQKIDQSYKKHLNLNSYQNLQPLNFNKTFQAPKKLTVAEVPHHPVELNYKAEVRSLSPVRNKQKQLLDLNNDLIVKKNTDQFYQKIQTLLNKKNLNLNFLKNINPKTGNPFSKRPCSPKKEFQNFENKPQKIIENYDNVQKLIQAQPLKVDNNLPQLNFEKYKFPQKF